MLDLYSPLRIGGIFKLCSRHRAFYIPVQPPSTVIHIDLSLAGSHTAWKRTTTGCWTPTIPTPKMLSLLARNTAARAPRSLPRSFPISRVAPGTIRKASTETNPPARDLLTRFAKLDPELYGILTVTLGAIGVFAYFFAGNPTKASDARPVPAVPGSEPWRGEGGTGKYMYYPQGNPMHPPKQAPSALNHVVIPNVNLPKELHEKYNKWGKPEYDI